MNALPNTSHGRLKLDDHRFIDPVSGEVVMDAPKTPRRKDRYYQVLADTNAEYFASSKKLGDVDRELLAQTAKSSMEFADMQHDDDYSSTLLKSEAYELAASAYHEGAIMDTLQALGTSQANDSVDERLGLIDAGNDALKKAIGVLSNGPMTTLEQRLLIKLDFNDVYKDIVCGEITQQTVDVLRASLNDHLYKTYNNVDSIHSRGLSGEIRTLLDIWNDYVDDNSVVGLPATVRGDSGFHNRSDTHDIDRLQQNDTGNWRVITPLEVKRRRITQWMLDRYTGSHLINVRVGGDVNLVQVSRTNHDG